MAGTQLGQPWPGHSGQNKIMPMMMSHFVIITASELRAREFLLLARFTLSPPA